MSRSHAVRERERVAAIASIAPPVELDMHPLIRGSKLTCPACEREQDVLAYTAMRISEKYAEQVVRPLKCNQCGHVFALRPGGADA